MEMLEQGKGTADHFLPMNDWLHGNDRPGLDIERPEPGSDRPEQATDRAQPGPEGGWMD